MLSSSKRSACIIATCVIVCPAILIYYQTQIAVAELDLAAISVAHENNNCTALSAQKKRKRPKLKSKPIWVASFPGSGAELFRQLVTSLANQPTVDSGYPHQHGCRKGMVVSCKTHWPNNPKNFPDPAFVKRVNPNVIVLLRNPCKAIPSWYNQIYEIRTNAPFHSRQAPEANWMRWSRHNYHQIESRFQEWADLILYWLDSRPQYTVDLFVPYEQMVDSETGPDLLANVTETLRRSQVDTLVAPTDVQAIHCLWVNTVQSEATMKRSSHQYTPSYTSEQQTNTLRMMDELIEEVSYREDLVVILKRYRREIETNLVIEDDKDKEKKPGK